ncbi:MAG: hypothetical protein HOH43_15615 [Candidatus Latescibacteria bacterium]|jgi:GNAT superfamily N-acetyltransferase|nr:hypothetical protein [Candidatus Latescibacterota bacterium]
MYSSLASARLTTGETIDISVVLAPDHQWQSQIIPFLGHKPGNFQWHLEMAFQNEKIPILETRFYLAVLQGQPICNIMTVEYAGIGILGHVYTLPAHRRKGVCRALMGEQMSDFTRRGGRYMTLGTGFDTHPYRIYESFGFRSVITDSGFMKFRTDDAFEAQFFGIEAVSIVKPDWRHWPIINVLCAERGGAFIRNVACELFGPSNFEGGYLTFLRGTIEDTRRDARLLVSATGAIVGYATVQPDRRWADQSMLVDLHLQANFTSKAHNLLRSLPLPTGSKILCWTESDTDWKIAALMEEGFQHEATLRNQVARDGRTVNAEVYSLET